MRKSFTVTRRRKPVVIKSPWGAAISLVVKRAIVCPAWFLRRRVKPHIVHSLWEKGPNDFERLDGPIQVLVIDDVLIMPQSRRWVRNLIADEENAIIRRIRL